MSTSIQQYEGNDFSLAQWRPPEQVLAEAKQAADALTKVISLKKNPVKFNGETYLEFEDWQTCAKFYGVTAKVERTAYVEYGAVRGFEAVAVAVDRNGMEISRAESLCTNDEANWGMVPEYQWQDELDEHGKKIWDGKLRGGKGGYKGKKVQVGEVAKPLFQLKSMAQTRACSKVLRQVFAWIVVLAGYRPTPAEEMTGNEQYEDHDPEPKKPPVQQPQRASEKSQQSNASEKEIAGSIETAKVANSGALWMTINGEALAVTVDADKIDDGMVQGAYIKLRGLLKKHDKLATKENPNGQFWALAGLIELSSVQDAEPVAEKTEMSPEMRETAEELEKIEQGGAESLKGMFDNGTLKKGSELPSNGGTKPGTIGKKRAQRCYTLCTQNKATNNGFNEAQIKRILAQWEPPLEHLSDLPVDDYPTFEGWATGESDWRTVWGEDGK